MRYKDGTYLSDDRRAAEDDFFETITGFDALLGITDAAIALGFEDLECIDEDRDYSDMNVYQILQLFQEAGYMSPEQAFKIFIHMKKYFVDDLGENIDDIRNGLVKE